MIAWLADLSETLPLVNVFRYISFRTAWGMISALMIAYLGFPAFIDWMNRRKMDQIIRTDGPESHLLNKVGTPTMGGLVMLGAFTASALLWARIDQPMVWMMLIVLNGYGFIGFYDDWKKVMLRDSGGLAGRYKILGQVVFGGGVLAWGHVSGVIEPVMTVPFLKDTVLDFRELWVGAPDILGWLYPAIGLFILVGTSNAVNLTDGLDGLAIGPYMVAAATYGVIAYVTGNVVFADYLGLHYVEGSGELAVLAMMLVGAGLGFLWYNAYPASVFMGDVGALGLGGGLGLFAILTHQELLLVLVGGVFVLETVSVIIQVSSFKATGKRVFLMTPIHHHYEKKGWSEPKIIVRFWILSILCALVALSTLKLR
jgi:phospho-N-acetylmuramoyl-pentapeptide-transferase